MADEDDWEVAVDTGKFDQQLKQHQRDRAASEVRREGEKRR